MARIVTKTGDKGTTGIFAGERVPKDDIRIEANGTMDELNAHLGLIRSMIDRSEERHTFIGRLQMNVMQMMSLIATPSNRRNENPNRFDPDWLTELEVETQRLMQETPNNGFFILPGGTPLSAQMQLARTVCRRAERRLWTLNGQDPLPEGLIPWVNRLSDYLFVLAKWEMNRQDWPDDVWQSFAYKRKKKTDESK
ncbi:MAG: cob(I)yrinic acid a,c-diamide adenosyltransferase [Porphyromonadaceae bacterium]|nr:cob(I)yrinic acid a,c-diamide adenosyltransferase [Porphyromonadaceae bacterium]